MGITENDELVAKHGSKHRNRAPSTASNPSRDMSMPPASDISEIRFRVNYSETDRMGVAYHGRYPVWLDMARTEHLRRTGVSYRELEDGGLLLTVSALAVRYRRSAEYDDLVRVRCWVRELASRRITFGYAVEHADRGELFATATTDLIAVDPDFNVVRMPEWLRERLPVSADPVRMS